MSDGDITTQTITTETITNELEDLNNTLAEAIRKNEKDFNLAINSINELKTSKDTAISEAADRSKEELSKLKERYETLQQSNDRLEDKLQGLNDISKKVQKIKANVTALVDRNNKNKESLETVTQDNPPSIGGYQYKSKSKKSNSKRMLKLNRFGLLKSRSKSKKSKKKLRPKKHKKGRRKSVKKGGMKRKSSKKNKKKTKKSKKKHTKRK